MGYQYLIPSLQLPDPDDRHVLAAAIHSGAIAIVTYNLKDFPKELLSPFGIEDWSPDFFVSRLLKYNIRPIINILEKQFQNLKNPPITFDNLLDRLNKNGLEKSVKNCKEIFDTNKNGGKVGSVTYRSRVLNGIMRKAM